jgi:hypothetical protein
MSTSTRQLNTATDVIFQSFSVMDNTDRNSHAVVSSASDDPAYAGEFASTLAGGIWFLVMLGVVFGSVIYGWQFVNGALLRFSITDLMNCI